MKGVSWSRPPGWGLLTKGISGEIEEADCNEEDVTQEQDGETSTSVQPFEAKTDPQQESIGDEIIQPEPRYPRRNRPPQWLGEFVSDYDTAGTGGVKKP